VTRHLKKGVSPCQGTKTLLTRCHACHAIFIDFGGKNKKKVIKNDQKKDFFNRKIAKNHFFQRI